MNGSARESSSDEEFEEQEEDEEIEACRCLFCSREHPSAASALFCSNHDHGVDFISIIIQLGCDHYSCIKLVNYIRKESVAPTFFSPPPSPPYPWDNDSYLKPVLEQDPLLLYDWESEIRAHSSSAIVSSSSQSETEGKVMEYKKALSQALADLQDMRLAMREMVGESQSNGRPLTTNTLSEVDEEEEEEKEEEEEGYFSTYSHFSIHLEMLSDQVRTKTYEEFISQNPALFKDKVVLDVGCGTGILSLFAARCGARLVIGVDQSFMVYNAMEIIRENGYENKVKLIRGKLEEVQLPVEKVDVVISEWMGYFLLFESMLDTVIFSRDKWLIDPKNLYPNVCTMNLVAVCDSGERETRIEFWDDVYGFKMSCMKTEILKEASVQCMEESSLISSVHTLKEFDLSTVTVNDLEFEEEFQLIIQQNSTCHAIVGYFEAGFNGPQYSGVLKTGPQDPPTHWKQTVFYLRDSIAVETGDVLEGKMKVGRSKQDQRALNIQLSFSHTLSTSHPPTTEPLSYTYKYLLR